jgi:NADPH-dependent ferric siderophore reductase
MTLDLSPTPPRFQRVQHELRRRELTVAAVDRLGPTMVRVTLAGDDLAGFPSLAADDHVKLFLPTPVGEPARRDFTPRRHDPATGRLEIDFALHEAGPASDWARQAAVGQRLTIGGPRGSRVAADPVDRWTLIGDETALPAIGRRIEEAAPGTVIAAVIAVPGPGDEQLFDTAAELTCTWVHRPVAAAADPAPLLAAVERLPAGWPGLVWIAAEAGVARALRAAFLDGRGHPPGWLQAKGYWVAGKADATESFEG